MSPLHFWCLYFLRRARLQIARFPGLSARLFLLCCLIYASIKLWNPRNLDGLAILQSQNLAHLRNTLAVEASNSISPPIKVIVMVGTRPEAIKLAPVILALRARPKTFRCILISTGQHRSMLTHTLAAFGMGVNDVDISLDLMTTDQTLSRLTARVLTSMNEVLYYIRPDMVIVQGDTTTAFVGALAAFYHKIPVGHVEAGLRTHNLYAPFPEEFNRQGVGILAALHFAATESAAGNLIREGKDPSIIFVTGNTVVDALKLYSKSEIMYHAAENHSVVQVQRALTEKCVNGGSKAPCRLVLLTAHRRENHGQPLQHVMAAIGEILSKHPDVLVVYPVHLNPNVREALRASVPGSVYAQLQDRSNGMFAGRAEMGQLAHYSRLLLLPPLQYRDLIRIMEMSNVIVTDSGGIQEEGAVMGKPILILREVTERPEGVRAGMATLVGTHPKKIQIELDRILQSGSIDTELAKRAKQLYGDGHASERITDLIQWYFRSRNQTGKAWPPPIAPYDPYPRVAASTKYAAPDIVVVLTVWRRNTLEAYLKMLSRQSVLSDNSQFRMHVLIFQNGDHINVTSIIDEWKTNAPSRWGQAASRINITYVHSPIATGYYGRFLAPFLVEVKPTGYFVVCDDDVAFGARYLENMLRVVEEGALAVRVGRFLGGPTEDGQGYIEHMGVTPRAWNQGVQVTYEADIEYDFGGQIWTGKSEWLRVLWQHPPPVLTTSEDFWISAVLRTFAGIPTKRPRCPLTDIDQCACSMKTANDHRPVEVGSLIGGEFEVREQAMGAIAREYGYIPLGKPAIDKEATAYEFHEKGAGPFAIEAESWAEECLYFA